jgi:hypothetical protein
MSDKRQKNQLMLAFAEEYRGEAPNDLGGGTESLTVKRNWERYRCWLALISTLVASRNW